MTFIERNSRYWIAAEAGLKNTELFALCDNISMGVVKTESIYPLVSRWRKAICPTTMASVYLKSSEVSREYGHRQVWRYGLEVAIKIKYSQGQWNA